MEEARHFSFFQNTQCEYFPCHPEVPKKAFNCLFCYCPLYALGRKCGGNCTYTENGVKDCSRCSFPHWKSNYSLVLERYADISEVVRRSDAQQEQALNENAGRE